MKKILKWTAILLLVGFVIIQFFRIDKSVPEFDKNGDFTVVNSNDAAGVKILKNACYDCHSFETKYPWYAEVAPISWWLADHIEEGREHVNFSLWTSYSAGDQAEIIEESIEEVQEGKMPDPNYVKQHPEAEMTDANKTALLNYLKSVGGSSIGTGTEEGEEDHD